LVLLLTIGLQAIAQETRTVTGKILDENGRGYPGAAIIIKGTTQGTVSDANGDFSLEVPEDRNVFIVQAVGYNTREIKETDGTIRVTLQVAPRQLEGAVVTAMAVKREKRELGYNTTTLSNADLTSGNSVSALNGLTGKVAGANITNSTGGPGGSTRVVLRGEKSILKNNNALIVVDGVITNNYDRTQSRQFPNESSELTQVDFGNSANDIDPDEIESVSVLTGPAGSALYGAIGANGVVMITTKAGKRVATNKASKIDVTYKVSYTQSDVLKFADMQHEYGQGDIYQGVPDDRRENFSWGYKFDGQLRPWGQAIDGKQLVKPYVDQPNNIKSFFNHGKNLTNFVSLSGGTETSTYFLSLNSINSTGVVPNTFYNKYSVRFNATTQLSNRLYSSVNVNYMNTYSRAESSGQADGSTISNLYQTARDIPVWELKDLDNPFYSMQYLDTNGKERYGYYGGYYKNPYWVAKNYDNRNKTDRILGDFKIGYKKGSFDVFNRLGIDMASDRSSYKTPNLDAEPVDPFYNGNNYRSAGGYAQSNYAGLKLYNDLIANFKHDLGNNFGINILAGHNTTIEDDNTLSATIDPGTNGLVIPNFYNFQNNVGPVVAYNTKRQRRTVGVYADISLNYQRELYFEITGRNDWTSTLVRGNNSYFYPGVNASWIFTERLKNTRFAEKILNYGKFRFGASGVGNDALPYVNNTATYSQGPIASGFGSVVPPFNNVPAYQISSSFADPQALRPERTNEVELGTDLAFFKNRLSLSFTYYNALTRNLVTAVSTAPSSGFLSQYKNIGDVRNRGIEITASGTPISTKYGLKWELFGTYTRNKNTVERLTNGLEYVSLGGFQGMDIVAAVGKPMGTFYANDIQTWNGKVVVDGTTGLPLATKTPVYKGSYQPKFIASWGTDVTYKGLRLHILFTTKQGGKYFSKNKLDMDFNGTSPETIVNNRESYVWPNSVYLVPGTLNSYVTNTTKFSPYAYYTTTEANVPAQAVLDASWVRLQELAITYKIPTKYYERSPFGGLEAGLYGNNLFLWTAKGNHYDDPEATSSGATGNAQGFNYVARPTLRNYGVYIKVMF